MTSRANLPAEWVSFREPTCGGGMRADMAKVLVERPRIGCRDGHGPVKGYRKRLQKVLDAGDSPPAWEGMKRATPRSKSFNEHLGPLRRFLDSNVGRPWDKVYSEICAHVAPANVVQKHILTHLFDYVVTHVLLIDRVPCSTEGFWYGRPLAERGRHVWYVCPQSGLLKRPKPLKPHPRRPALPAFIRVNDRLLCKFLRGHWELIEVVPLPVLPKIGRGWDVVLGKPVSEITEREARAEYGAPVSAVARRQLRKTELIQYPIPIDLIRGTE